MQKINILLIAIVFILVTFILTFFAVSYVKDKEINNLKNQVEYYKNFFNEINQQLGNENTDLDRTPKISYSVSAADNQITITKCTPSDTQYASSATSANLIFKNNTETFYVKSGGVVSTTQSGCINDYIEAGDVISGFFDGATYTVIWVPTNEVLGSFST